MSISKATDAGSAERAVELSIVIPVYGCTAILPTLCERLRRVLRSLALEYEILLVEDGGRDGGWEAILALAADGNDVRGIKLSRNFGQHQAITAGLHGARGAWAVVMDCDLQDPPEEIPRLYAKAAEGYEVVLAKRKRKQLSVYRKLASRIYFWISNLISGRKLRGEYGSFSIISRKVIEAFKRVRDIDRHFLLVVDWLGFETGHIEYQHSPRYEGHSSYGTPRLLKHALSGLLFQTTVLLRWIIYLGFAVSFLGLLLAARFTYDYFAYQPPAGWTSLAVLVLILSGAILISTGITGLYIGRIFEQVRGRPLFVVDRVTNGEVE